MVKFLAPVHRKLNAIALKFGITEDYAEYSARILSILNVKRVLFAEDLPNVGWYSDIDGQIANHFYNNVAARRRIAAWIDARRVKAAA